MSQNIQFRPKQTDGFFEGERRVPVVFQDHDGDHQHDHEADIRAAQAEAVDKILSSLIAGTTDLAEIGERTVTIACCLGLPQAPDRSCRALGAYLNCSHETARRKLANVQHLLARMSG
jgi:hypothetical protein